MTKIQEICNELGWKVSYLKNEISILYPTGHLCNAFLPDCTETEEILSAMLERPSANEKEEMSKHELLDILWYGNPHRESDGKQLIHLATEQIKRGMSYDDISRYTDRMTSEQAEQLFITEDVTLRNALRCEYMPASVMKSFRLRSENGEDVTEEAKLTARTYELEAYKKNQQYWITRATTGCLGQQTCNQCCEECYDYLPGDMIESYQADCQKQINEYEKELSRVREQLRVLAQK